MSTTARAITDRIAKALGYHHADDCEGGGW